MVNPGLGIPAQDVDQDKTLKSKKNVDGENADLDKMSINKKRWLERKKTLTMGRKGRREKNVEFRY